MALIMEKAGGAASNGRERILDLVPNHIHDRSPIILGNKDDVKLFESLQTALQTEWLQSFISALNNKVSLRLSIFKHIAYIIHVNHVKPL